MTQLDKDRIQEEKRLQTVITAIERELQKAKDIAGGRKSDVLETRKYIWDDLVYDSDDWFEAAVNITQESRELARQAQSYAQAEQTVRRLGKLQDNPYFGRLDFHEDGLQEIDRIYIGLSSFVDETTGDIYIYDWRAPIAGMYYDYGPGPAQYQSPEGPIGGNIELKRQFIIRGGRMIGMFDTGVSIGDEMLKEMLGKHADDKMKSIVTTIQREQNQIIRDTEHKYLLVQGAAGSGKTSAALQRVAYLLYKYRNRWTEDQLMLFSPNAIFNDYVSNVLPELGENQMQQTTFQEYLENRFGSSVTIEDPYDQTEYVLSAYKEPSYTARIQGIRFKASKAYFELIERYVEHLGREGMQFVPFMAGEKTLISVEQLQRLFYETFAEQPVPSRITKMREWLVGEIQAKAKERVQKWFRNLQKQPKYLGSDEELKAMAKRKARKVYGPLQNQAKKLAFIDITALYRALLTDEQLVRQLIGEASIPEAWKAIASDTLERMESGVPYEDAAPLLLLKEGLHGFSALRRMRHVVIDEAQDYSPFQLLFMKRLFPGSGMTLLGDVNQAILAHSDDSGHLRAEDLLGQEETAVIRLSKSYRSTEDIVHFTNEMLTDHAPAVPFERKGKKPLLVSLSDEQKADNYSELLRILQDEGYESIAIICKTAQECEEAFALLKPEWDVHLITKTTRTFIKGLLIIPSYLAKGLEFDAVLIYDAGERRYAREEERKLFYTVCTRALHRLVIAHSGKITPFIAQHVSKERYEVTEK
ncbi:RNA polymerase recycling motor HelD [Paenibacillus turpanensis]|uniref:RNA polymerase recycling motor HelD n=1 Tax=Paenibacillus turpanensis TaxID=2689078 RepID=UPI001407D7FB|nr:RNA polymerase recycling motor HelD [Paenibacillus turpanensis]